LLEISVAKLAASNENCGLKRAITLDWRGIRPRDLYRWKEEEKSVKIGPNPNRLEKVDPD
jgi:hypothetical protein